MRAGICLAEHYASEALRLFGASCQYLGAPLLPGKNGTKRGVSCGSSDMIAYRKFSDIQWDEFETSTAPNPPKAPKVGGEAANDTRTLDGLGALAASCPELQNGLIRDSVVAEHRAGKNPQVGKEGAKAAKAPKDQISPSLAGSSDAREGSADWSADDWRARFDELRANAEIGAFNSCIAEWLNRNPSPSLAGRCAWCGKAETPSAM